ncbi:MAG: LysR substrate-binding domain-containing protein, partial [Hyphomonadaceae bacterium]
ITERSQLIEQFRIQRPHCALRVNTMRQVAVLQALRRGALDVAIIIGVGMARELYDAQLADGQANEGGYPLDLPIAAIQSRPFCLRAPPEWVLSKRRAVHSSELKGKELIMIDIEHSAEVLGAMAAFFREAGAHIVFAPGGGHVDAMRCGAKRRTPIVSLGWFDALEKETAPDFVPVAITDCPRKVDLVVLRAAGEVRPPAAHFIEQAVTLLGPPPEAEGRAAAEHPLGR